MSAFQSVALIVAVVALSLFPVTAEAQSCAGLGGTEFSLNLGRDFSDSTVDWGNTVLDTVFQSPPWAQEIYFYWTEDNTQGRHIWFSNFWFLRFQPSVDPDVGEFLLSVDTTVFPLQFYFQLQRGQRVALKVEAWESGGDAFARVLINGKVIGSDSIVGADLDDSASSSTTRPSLGHFTIPQQFSAMPMRLWSVVGATDEEAEDLQRLYLFNSPEPDAPGLEGLWYRQEVDSGGLGTTLYLVDETVNGYDGVIDPGAFWGSQSACVP